MLELLRNNAAFRHFWLAQVSSQIGDRIHTLAVLWLVYDWTRSGTALGLVMVASTLPAILIAPWTGYVADRHDRRMVAIVADGVRAVLVLVLAVLALLDRLDMTLLVLVTALISLASAFFNPAALAMIPQLVAPAELTRANSIGQLSANASGALGFLAGSGLIAIIGVPAAFLTNACSFLFSATFLSRIARQRPERAAATSMVQSLREGWLTVRSIPVVVRLLPPLVIINFLFSSLIVLIPIFAEGSFDSGPGGMGTLLGTYTAGMLLAALVVGNVRISTSVATLVGTSLLMVATAFLAMGLFASFAVFVVGLLLIGLGLNGINICLITLFQRLIPESALGKFFSLLMALSLSAQPLAFGFTGWLSDHVDPATLLLACAAAMFACAIYSVQARALREQAV